MADSSTQMTNDQNDRKKSNGYQSEMCPIFDLPSETLKAPEQILMKITISVLQQDLLLRNRFQLVVPWLPSPVVML
jgi:hypothetical protein